MRRAINWSEELKDCLHKPRGSRRLIRSHQNICPLCNVEYHKYLHRKRCLSSAKDLHSVKSARRDETVVGTRVDDAVIIFGDVLTLKVFENFRWEEEKNFSCNFKFFVTKITSWENHFRNESRKSGKVWVRVKSSSKFVKRDFMFWFMTKISF